MASSNGHGRRQHHDAERERETGAFAGGAPGGRTLNQWVKSSPAQCCGALPARMPRSSGDYYRHCTGSAGEPCHDPCHELPRLPAHADYVT